MWTADIQMKWRCDHRRCDCDCKHNCDDHTFISETQLFTFLMLSIAVHIFVIIKIFAVDDNLTNTKLRVHTSIPINFFAIYVNSTIAKCCASVELMNHFLRNWRQLVILLYTYILVALKNKICKCVACFFRFVALKKLGIYMCREYGHIIRIIKSPVPLHGLKNHVLPCVAFLLRSALVSPHAGLKRLKYT